MRRTFGWTAALLFVATAAAAGWLYRYCTHLEYVQLTDDVWMISGFGGNVGVLRTDAGSVIVDTMNFPMQGERIEDLAATLTGQRVAIVVNTHYHRDHTHGNPPFAGKARIISTERTRELLRSRDGDYWKGEAAAALPAETFTNEHEISLGGKMIRLVHPGRGHTDGDLVALFVEDRVIHMGDLVWNGVYPNIDLEAGGTVAEWPATLDALSPLGFDFVIPGHGGATDRDGIKKFRAFLVELWEKTSDAARRGLSLDQTLESVDLQTDEGMEKMEVPFIIRLDRDFDVTRAWQEATGTVKPPSASPAEQPAAKADQPAAKKD